MFLHLEDPFSSKVYCLWSCLQGRRSYHGNDVAALASPGKHDEGFSTTAITWLFTLWGTQAHLSPLGNLIIGLPTCKALTPVYNLLSKSRNMDCYLQSINLIRPYGALNNYFGTKSKDWDTLKTINQKKKKEESCI